MVCLINLKNTTEIRMLRRGDIIMTLHLALVRSQTVVNKIYDNTW